MIARTGSDKCERLQVAMAGRPGDDAWRYRQQKSIENHLSTLLMEIEQARAAEEQARAAEEQARMEKEAALAEIERLKALLRK